MYAADSELKVWRLSEGSLHQLLVVKELEELWRRFDVNITSTEEYQVRLIQNCVSYTTIMLLILNPVWCSVCTVQEMLRLPLDGII